MEHGFPQGSVYAVIQTHDGYIWLGTLKGLVRFDGIRFRIFNKENTGQLKDNSITALLEDTGGALWIGTSEGGLSCLKNGEFITYTLEECPGLKEISTIFQDRAGVLWMGTLNSGLTCLKNGIFKTYNRKDGLVGTRVQALLEDKEGRLMIATGAGLAIQTSPGRFMPWHARAPYPGKVDRFDKYIISMIAGVKGGLWIGCSDGLYRLEDDTLTYYGPDDGLPNPKIRCLYEDKNQNLWAGTDGGGLIRVKNGKIETLSTAEGLECNYISALYEDREGSLWVGTLEGGLHRLRDTSIITYTTREGLSHEKVKCVIEDRRGSLWIGTEGGGVNRLKDGKLAPVLSVREGLLSDVVNCIMEDSAGNIWIGTDAGLNRFRQGKLIGFTTGNGLSSNRILGLLEDKKGVVWIVTSNYIHQFHQGRFTVFSPAALGKTAYESIQYLYKDREGNFWFILNNSMSLYRLKNGKITTIEGLVNNDVESFYEDNEGTFYIGTRGGLSRLAGGKFTNYTAQNGLIDSNIRHIMEDLTGNLWLASRVGISRVSKKELSDFARGEIEIVHPVTFDELDGMKGSWCEDGTRTRDGRLWFTSSLGLVMIDPGDIKNNPLPPPVIIEEMRMDGESVDIHREPAVIPPGKKRMEFQYSAPSFLKPGKITFKIKLEGYDSDWVDVGHDHSATYTALSPGKYTFKVTAGNSDGIWNPTGAFFSFYVIPPWYKTWWAFLIYGATVLLIMYLVVRWRSWRLVQDKQKLEQIVEERTEKINDQNRQLLEQAEKLKELDEAKSRFFANISHEFRTPLTLIMGPLEKRLSMSTDNRDSQEIGMMLRNSRRLLNLINQLLELARLDSGKMKLEVSPQNIVPFLKNIVICFESLAAHNKVDLIFQKQEEDITVYFDPEKLEKIMTNLLSNAFNYTPAGGKVAVSVRGSETNERFPAGCVEITVRDTGAGIPRDRLPHIFDRFYRGEAVHEYKGKGSGIGLALTKELVELHHGEIEAQSSCRDDDSRGSEFLLRLPMGEGHLEPGDIVTIKSFEQPFTKGGWQPQPIRPPAGPPEVIEPTDEPEEPGEIEEVAATMDVENEKEEKVLVLVVEDNADVRAYIKSSLEPQFKVLEAVDGKQGIQRAKEIIPDIIISDVMMPGVDGFQLCREIKNDILTCHIPVILLTAKVSEDSILRGLETGADDYITKPFSTVLLEARVRNLVDLRRRLQLESKNRMAFQPWEIAVSPLDDEFYKKLQEVIENNIADPDFGVEALCRGLGMSQATLYRKLQAMTGKSPTLFLRTFRMKRAAQLLRIGTGSIAEIAGRVGFVDRSYFARCFKEQFQCLPSDIQSPGVSGPVEEIEAGEKFYGGSRGAVFQKSPPGGRGQETILLVEDSEDARDYIRGSLEPDYHIVEAVDGNEGLARAMEVIPDLIISDIMMPGMDGYELCRVLKQDIRSSHIPIILLTARAEEESRIRGLETGADDYITKPFNTRILRARIKNLIQLRSDLQEKRNREMALLPVKISEPEMDREFMKELNAVIEQNLEDPDFNVEQLAKKLYMSSATLYRKIQALSGEIPSGYIRSYRLRRAAQLFKENFGSVTEVAFEVGFTSRTYFTKCFKEQYHRLPSVYMSAEAE